MRCQRLLIRGFWVRAPGAPPTRQSATLISPRFGRPSLTLREHPSQTAGRRTSHTVAAMSSTDSPSSQPPSIHWNDQNRLAG
jgi:hypothetical protein